MGEQDETVVEEGLSAYVGVHDPRTALVVVLCRACGDRSPPLTSEDATAWFKRHAAKKSEAHRRWRTRQSSR